MAATSHYPLVYSDPHLASICDQERIALPSCPQGLRHLRGLVLLFQSGTDDPSSKCVLGTQAASEIPA